MVSSNFFESWRMLRQNLAVFELLGASRAGGACTSPCHSGAKTATALAATSHVRPKTGQEQAASSETRPGGRTGGGGGGVGTGSRPELGSRRSPAEEKKSQRMRTDSGGGIGRRRWLFGSK